MAEPMSNRKTETATLWDRLKWPLVSAVVISGLLLVEYWVTLRPIWDKIQDVAAQGGKTAVSVIGPGWWHEVQAIAGLLVAALAISTAVWLFVDGARKRAAARGESFGSALWAILSKARTQTGGYLTHFGVGLVLIGLVGSAMFVDDLIIQIPYEQKILTDPA